jgi:hypothetical protein
MARDDELLEPQVERKLAALWSADQKRANARAALARYGTESYECEIERVRMAILKLSEGVLSELLRMTDAAKLDYRDVLMWAEYPEEGKALWSVRPNLSEAERRELEAVRARDRAQLDAWRRK